MQKLYGKTPIVVSIFTAITIIGAFFPVYGISLGGVKLTLFRLGVFPLLITQAGSLFKFNKKLVYIVSVFFLMRLITLIWSNDMSNGVKQLSWFFEGSCLLFSVNSAFNKYSDFGKIFTNLSLIIGALSISFLLIQAICYFGLGYKFYVPFTQNIPELTKGGLYWNYPIYGSGRIIGAFYDPNMAGSMCCYYFALLLPFLSEKNRNHRLLLAIFLLVIAFASLFTGSRQSVVGIVLILLLYFSYFLRNKFKSVLYFALFVGVTLFVASNYLDNLGTLFEDSENVFSRIEDASGGDYSGGRFDYMERVWNEYGMVNFFMGVGEGVTHGGGHNAFLAVFLENGIFTLIAFITMLWKLWYTSLLNYKRNSMPICISSCLIIISWVFLLFVNWAQLNQSLSFIYIGVVFLSLSKFTRIIH